MLVTLRKICNLTIDESELRKAFSAMSEFGWIPALLKIETDLLRLAGLNLPYAGHLRNNLALGLRRGNNLPVVGDVFFRENDLYYCIFSSERIPPEIAFNFVLGSGAPDDLGTQNGLGIGVITELGENAEVNLLAFGDAIKSALNLSLDGRKFRHLTFAWEPIHGSDVLEKFIRPASADEAISFRKAELDSELVAGAEALTYQLTREIVREINQAGFAREKDIIAKRGRKHEEVKGILEDLKRLIW